MGTINPSLPTLTNPNSTEDPLIRTALSTIVAEFNGNIDNNNIKTAAAIAYSKMATMNTGQILLGNAGVPTATTLSGPLSISALGVTSISGLTSAMITDGTIVNADVNAAAAIAYSKLALAGGIVNADINASAAIADTKLASSNQGSYRTILNAASYYPSGQTSAAARALFANGGSVMQSGGYDTPPMGVVINSADYAVSGFTPKLRIRGAFGYGGTQTNVSLTFAMNAISQAAGLWNVSTEVSGSPTTASLNGSANTIGSVVTTTPFSFPANGYYILSVGFSGAGTTSSAIHCTAALEYAHF